MRVVRARRTVDEAGAAAVADAAEAYAAERGHRVVVAVVAATARSQAATRPIPPART